MKFYTPLSTLLSARRALLVGAFAIAGVTLLQGCFPAVVVGVGATALVASDRRTPGTYLEDQSIEWKVSSLMRKNFGTLNRIYAISYNRNVLLTGEVQDENVRAEAERLAGTVLNVRTVVNELDVGAVPAFWARRNDDAITANVKARFLNNGVFSPNHVKVFTTKEVVFLLGIVTSAEAEEAARIASESKGVKKVVKVFEFIGEDEAQTIDTRNTQEGDNNFPPEAP
jgi:osmotically-inducible protein OsmY